MLTLDKIDRKLLFELSLNSRQPTTILARKLAVSREVVDYRIKRLVEKKIIRDFITNINYEKLGYISAFLLVSINAEKETEFIEYVNSLDYVSWAGTHLGFWSLGMAIYGKNISEVEERFQKIFLKYKNHITNHRFSIYKTTEFFTDKYFGKHNSDMLKKKNLDYKINSYDKFILKTLAKSSRTTAVDLSKEISLSAVAIAKRIKKLEASGYIQGYSIYVNVLKLSVYLFIFFIQNKSLEQRKKLFSYLKKHPKVSLLLDYVGDPFIEFGLFVDDPYKARKILQEIKETFPDNELIDFFLTQEDFISYGVPKCVFE